MPIKLEKADDRKMTGCHAATFRHGRNKVQVIKNERELFLTSPSDGPKDGGHGWQAIKNPLISLSAGLIYGAADGTRTRDPRRDRPVF
jgi:hypothetical protein